MARFVPAQQMDEVANDLETELIKESEEKGCVKKFGRSRRGIYEIMGAGDKSHRIIAGSNG